MIISWLLLAVSILALIKSADFAIHYSSRIASDLGLPRYVVGFLIVAVISILPEASIAINSAIDGVPSLGLGTLFGSNIADLTLVTALVVIISGRGLKVESEAVKYRWFHIGALITAVILGIDGAYSRVEGAALVFIGLLFYGFVITKKRSSEKKHRRGRPIDFLLFLVSISVLLVASDWTVDCASRLAVSLQISPMIIGMFVIGLGTTLPELLFSIKAARKNQDGLALGDILGTVIADATILVGLLALISPFSFNARIIYASGPFMVFSALVLFRFMRTGKTVSRLEAVFLILVYLIFVAVEVLLNGI